MRKVFFIFILLLFFVSGMAFTSAHAQNSEVDNKKTFSYNFGFSHNNMMREDTTHNNMMGIGYVNNNMWSFNSNMRNSHMNYWSVDTIHKDMDRKNQKVNREIFSWFSF